MVLGFRVLGELVGSEVSGFARVWASMEGSVANEPNAWRSSSVGVVLPGRPRECNQTVLEGLDRN